jgi:hypothetical protein
MRVSGLRHLADEALHHATAPRQENRAGDTFAEESDSGGGGVGEEDVSRPSSNDGTDAGWVTDPGAGLLRAKKEFRDARAAADAAQHAAMTRSADAVLTPEAHARAMKALTKLVDAPQLSIRRWALEAEKLHLEERLAEVARAKWYMHVVHQATEGGRCAVSRGEAAVLMRVKEVCETQRCAFDANALLRLLESMPRNELEQPDTQRGILLLREEVGLQPETLRAFMQAKGLPVPLALRVGDGTRTAKVRGSTYAGSAAMGTDAPRASMRLSMLGVTRE